MVDGAFEIQVTNGKLGYISQRNWGTLPLTELVGSLFIEFRKAFDVVDHSILLKKLYLYKLSETALQ